MNKKTQKRTIDTAMMIFFVLAMSSSAFEKSTHEYISLCLLLCVLLHQILNFWWFKSVFKMRKTPLNLVKNGVNFLLIVSSVLTIISGIAMSKSAVPFLSGFMKISAARSIHLCASHWFFVFAGLHFGFHLLNLAKKANSNKLANAIFIASWLVSIYGIWLFLDNEMLDYMLIKSQFAFLDFKAPLWQTLTNTALTAFSLSFIGFLIVNFLSNLKDEK